MKNNAKLRVAQIGVGGFGAHRRLLMRQTGLFELVAAYDHNPEALKHCQAEDGARPVSSCEELLATPGIEAVVISTGAKFHAEQALAAMARGLHVFVEKPLCATPAEVEALLAAQQKSGVVVAVGHADHRHKADSTTIQRMIESGDLGRVATFECTTAHSGGQLIQPGDWRGDPGKNPGGMLFQCGVHAIHELMFYFGPMAEVASMMRYDVHTTLTADVAICHLKFASGLIGSLNAYHVTPYRHTLNIFGTKMSLYREELFYDEGTRLWRQATHLDGKKEPEERVPIEGATDEAGNLRSFHRAIREGGVPYPSLLDGARAVQAVFAAEESAKTGRAVAVPRLG
jgi:predicted dehydrogenase